LRPDPHRQRALLIFNPEAGQGSAHQDGEQIWSLLSEALDLQVKWTTPEVTATHLAQEGVNQGVDLVIAVGGDGTVSGVARALVGTSTALGIIPYGTANVFASALSIPTDLTSAGQTLVEGKLRIVDVANCNGLPFFLKASVGYGAETLQKTSRTAKRRLGVLAYVLEGIRQFGSIRPFQLTLETETSRLNVNQATALEIANAATFTSVLTQGPATIPFNDGFLDATVTRSSSLLGMLAAIIELFRSGLQQDRAKDNNITHERSRYFRVVTDPCLPVVLDGETAGMTPLTIECWPQSLQVIVPHDL
jgi:YegS/Rv2252/BmrU family lipid kinase